MPTLKGFTLGIHAHFDQNQYPEFPHPETSKPAARDRFTKGAPSSNERVQAPKHIDTISVYIPSVSASRFFIKYTIKPPFPPGVFVFFKLIINGRPIASWGINPRLKPRGQLTRALFQADESWNFDFNGRTCRREDIESRTLMFAKEVAPVSTSLEGGLIEIRIFRSCGRQRRSPQAGVFKSQEQYGLLFPSSGLVENPAEDARMYDWILTDPKDEPYAIFKFYYRSWDNLAALNIMPPSQLRKLLPISPSFGTLSDYIAQSAGNTQVEDKENNRPSLHATQSTEPFAHPATSILGILKHQRRSSNHSHIFDTRPQTRSITHIAAKTQRRPSRHQLYASTLSIFNAADGGRSEKLQNLRPLPDLPDPQSQRSSPEVPRRISNASVSSVGSAFVTPSLRSWVNGGAISRSPSPAPSFSEAWLVELSVSNGSVDAEEKSILMHGDMEEDVYARTQLDTSNRNLSSFPSPAVPLPLAAGGAMPLEPSLQVVVYGKDVRSTAELVVIDYGADWSGFVLPDTQGVKGDAPNIGQAFGDPIEKSSSFPTYRNRLEIVADLSDADESPGSFVSVGSAPLHSSPLKRFAELFRTSPRQASKKVRVSMVAHAHNSPSMSRTSSLRQHDSNVQDQATSTAGALKAYEEQLEETQRPPRKRPILRLFPGPFLRQDTSVIEDHDDPHPGTRVYIPDKEPKLWLSPPKARNLLGVYGGQVDLHDESEIAETEKINPRDVVRGVSLKADWQIPPGLGPRMVLKLPPDQCDIPELSYTGFDDEGGKHMDESVYVDASVMEGGWI